MTTRGQILRSSTPGQAPAAGTRLPGELWTTFPDLQLGVIDASKNAQKLVAVRYFSTTANYAVGDFVVQAGVLYAAKVAVTAGAFNPAQWTQIGAPTDLGGPYLPIAGGTLAGALTLNADPGAALGAATKQYVDGKVSAAPFLPIAGGTLTGLVTLSGPPSNPLHAATKAYVDAGAFVPVGGGANTGLNDNRLINGNFAVNQRGQVSATALAAAAYGHDRWKAGAGGCTYTFTATLPDTTITITAGSLLQIIEGGGIEGGVCVLSWTGTAKARVYQGTATGSYVASPLITASLTAGADTTVDFNAGTLTKVKFEIGSVATPYNRQSLAKSMIDCQRYYCNLSNINLSAGPPATAAGQQTQTPVTLPVTMRAAPTISVPTVTSTNCSGAGSLNQFPTGFGLYITALGAGSFYGTLGPITAAAEL